MSKTRNIARGIKIEVANGTRKCHVNKAHTINPGDTHLAVYEAQVRENICLVCARDVLDVAIGHLADTKA